MEESFRIVNNLLRPQPLAQLNSLLLSRHFPFYWHSDIDNEGERSDISNYGFSHEIYNKSKNSISNFFPNFEDTIIRASEVFNLNPNNLLRVRVVMLTNVGRPHKNKAHVDLDGNGFSTIVFYPHETDGSFYWLSDGKMKEQPIQENMCVFMKGRIPHHGSNPVSHSRRIVINANFSI